MYCAVIGDIVKSKRITDRGGAQKELEAQLEKTNKRHAAGIASKFTITLGDEFQALLAAPSNIMEIINEIKSGMAGMSIRFGIGLGDITTEINSELSIGADGPAYYSARRALSEIKEFERKYSKPVSDIRIYGGKPDSDKKADVSENEIALINSALSACAFIKSKWTDKQKNVIDMIKLGASQRAVARELGINQSGVQRMIATSGYYTYSDAMHSVQNSINALWEKINER
jgi:hypothetical protein